MRKIREILRLSAAGLSARQIAGSVGVARSTVADCLLRAGQADLGWPLPAALDDVELERRLYPPAPVRDDAVPVPHWPRLHAELQRKGVTLLLLWQEYKATVPAGYQYSRFCDLYRAWSQTQDLVLRQTHAPGDKCFVDYAGQTAEVVDPKTGEIFQAQVFVAVLGHSSYTYAEASWTQGAADWCASQVRALEFFGGAPAAIVPDNLKAGVIKPDRYDPDLNPAYQEFAAHYDLAILPARVRKPRDKAKVEVGVQVVERWILARLRHSTFFSLAALNQAIAELVTELNQKPFQKRDGSRTSVFAATDQPALCPLPADRYEFAAWKKAKVHLDYHVEVERRWYSVPHALVGKTVTVRLTAQAVEIFHRGQRVAAHLRSPLPGTFTTLTAHRPQRHQAIVDLSHEKLLRQAEAIGPVTAGVLYAQIHARKHPEYALRASLGILRLGKDFSPEKLEAACTRALALKSTSYRAIRALIQNGAAQAELTLSLPEHENLRGSSYFH